MEKIGVAIALAAMTMACSSDDEEPPFTLGELRGTWRLSYVEQNGTCGPM